MILWKLIVQLGVRSQRIVSLSVYEILWNFEMFFLSLHCATEHLWKRKQRTDSKQRVLNYFIMVSIKKTFPIFNHLTYIFIVPVNLLSAEHICWKIKLKS